MRWLDLWFLTLGGILGVHVRHGLGLWIVSWAGGRYPWATFVINVTGAFLAGFISLLLTRWLPDPRWRLLCLTGFLGGYTTFSAMMLESVRLWEREGPGPSLIYLGSSLLIGFLAVVLGLLTARTLLGTEPSAALPPAPSTAFETPANPEPR